MGEVSGPIPLVVAGALAGLQVSGEHLGDRLVHRARGALDDLNARLREEGDRSGPGPAADDEIHALLSHELRDCAGGVAGISFVGESGRRPGGSVPKLGLNLMN